MWVFSFKLLNEPRSFLLQLEIASESFTLSRTGSEENPPVFGGVRTVLLRSKEPRWSTKTFTFIRDNFPNLRTVYFLSVLSNTDKVLFNYYIQECQAIFPELFNDDFCQNGQVQLATVSTIYLDIEYSQYSNQTLQCLFSLLPNLITMKTHSLEKAQRLYNHRYSDVVKNRLRSLKIEPLSISKDPDGGSELFFHFCEKRSQ